ncbi:hypothetical protein BX600DRAFT_440800 [Xylariales sp. PMI_506]|nr:hypothetical protein BX600DRAFT_440800 [Xylariales sp. PMI_506]
MSRSAPTPSPQFFLAPLELTTTKDCKKRHIKCDEKRPACSACVAASRRCPFLDSQPTRPLSTHIATPPSEVASSPALSSKPATSSPCPSASGFQNAADLGDAIDARLGEQGQQPTPCFDMRHLVLLHHFENELIGSSGSLPWVELDGSRPCFNAIFNSAVAAPYLMHELLAFSALHLSTLQSDSAERAQYLQLAADLQSRALALFNAVKPQVRNENCMALFVFSSFIGLHTLFDAIASCTEFNGLLEKITHYLKLHRGVSAITQQSWPVLRHSELRHIIDAIEAGTEAYQQYADEPNECDKLVELIRNSSDKLSPASLKACQDAIQALRWVFGVRRHLSEPYPSQVTSAWPIRISAEFVELLEQRQPIPLIILAHWAVLLHIDRNFWVFGNAGRHIIESLSTYLGSYWDEWLELPRSVLNAGS